MPVYRVVLQGSNVLMQIDDDPPRKYGFRVTRFVEAPNVSEARMQAARAVWTDPKLVRGSLNAAQDPPRVVAVEAERADRPPAVQPGFAFFPE